MHRLACIQVSGDKPRAGRYVSPGLPRGPLGILLPALERHSVQECGMGVLRLDP